MNRRRLLVALGAVSTTTLAGCLGSGDDDGETPEPETNSTTPEDDPTPEDEGTPAGEDGADEGDEYEDLDVSYTSPMTTRSLDYEFVSPYPTLEFSRPVPVDDSISFTVENVDTGKQVTVDVSEGESVETDEVALALYRPTGELRGPDAEVVYWPLETSGRERLDTHLGGDEETFTERGRATYRATMFRDDAEVGTAGEVAMSVGHPQEFDSDRDGDTLEVGFSAGDLPTDGSLSAKIQTGDGVESESVAYDEEVNRFVATFDAGEIPSGEHRVTLHVTNPETGLVDLVLGATLQV